MLEIQLIECPSIPVLLTPNTAWQLVSSQLLLRLWEAWV